MAVYQARIITKLTDLDDWSETGMITQQTLILEQNGEVHFSEEELTGREVSETGDETELKTQMVHEQTLAISASAARGLLALLGQAALRRHFRYRAEGADAELIERDQGWMLTLFHTDGQMLSVGSKDMNGLAVDGICVGQKIRDAIPIPGLCLFGKFRPFPSGRLVKARIRTQLASPLDVEEGKVMDEELTLSEDGAAGWLEHVFLAPEDEFYAWLCGRIASQRERHVRIGARSAREILDLLLSLPDPHTPVPEADSLPLWQVDLLDENGYAGKISAGRDETLSLNGTDPSGFIRSRIPIEGMTLFDPITEPSPWDLTGI